MAEQEELRLTVTVDDQASAQLQALRGQLSSMGGGAQAAGLERMRRQTGEVGQGVIGLEAQLRSLATRAGIVGGVVGAVTGKLVEMGIQFVQRATDVKAYSEALVTLHRNSQLAGTSAAQFQANMNSMRESSGVGAEQAAAGLQKFGEVWVDLQRQNSQARRTLTAGLQGQDLRNMQNLLTSMARTDTTSAMNMYLDYADKIEQFWIDQGQAARGAQVRREFLARGGLESMERGRRFEQPTPEQQARIDARLPAAQRHQELLRQEQTIWNEIQGTLSAILLQYGGFNSGLETTNEWAIKVKNELLAWETALRGTDGSIKQLEDATRTWGATTQTFVGQEIAKAASDFRKIFDDLKASYQWLVDKGFITAPAPPREPLAEQLDVEREQNAPPQPPPPAGIPTLPPLQPLPNLTIGGPTVDWLRYQGTQEIAPLSPEEAQRAQEARDAAAAAAQRRFRPRRGERPPPQPMPPPPESPFAARFGEWPQPAPPAAPVTGAAGAVPQQFIGPQIITAPPPPGVVQVPPPAPPAPPPAPEPRAYGIPSIADLLKPVAGAAPATPGDFAGTGWRGLPISRNVEVQREPAPPPPIVVSPPETRPPSIILPPAPAPIIVPQAVAPMPWTVPQPRQLGPQQETRAPEPSAFEGGATSLMGGRAMDQAAAQGMPDARALDRAAGARDVNVNGSGKISVDVRAPAGTAVSAQGGGLFKRTEITRQTQMLPADFGAAPATGANAGE